MLVNDYLAFAGKLRGMDSATIKKRIPVSLELTDLTDVRWETIRNLSHGYRQRVGVAQAIMHEPKLLILDEPTRGLDPVQIVEMRSMIQNLKEKHTVLISSHILTEISETCDRLLVLGKGEILATGSEEDLSSKMATTAKITMAIRSTEKSEDLIADMKKVDGVTDVDSMPSDDGAQVFELSTNKDIRPELCRAMVASGHDIIGLARSERELENIFIKLVHGGNNASN